MISKTRIPTFVCHNCGTGFDSGRCPKCSESRPQVLADPGVSSSVDTRPAGAAVSTASRMHPTDALAAETARGRALTDSLNREIKRLEYLCKCGTDGDRRIRQALLDAGEHPDANGAVESIRRLADRAAGKVRP